MDGTLVGFFDGCEDGSFVGQEEGFPHGCMDGCDVGSSDGLVVG